MALLVPLLPSLRGAAGKIGGLFRPLTQGGREMLAAQKIAGTASDFPAVQEALQNPTELVPGSVPTTFQVTEIRASAAWSGQSPRTTPMSSSRARVPRARPDRPHCSNSRRMGQTRRP